MIQDGEVVLGQSYYGINLTDWNLLSGDGDALRTYEVPIIFPVAFSEAPRLQVSLGGFYVIGSEPRILVGYADVGPIGFLLQVSTWGCCRVQGVQANWLAYDSVSAAVT